MKKYFILIIVFSILLISCEKDLLDFSSDTYFGIEEFLKSENCNAECGTAASCEGEIIGFDAPTNFSCDRMFTMKLTDELKIFEQ
jgi:hypothetical protein